MTSGPNMARTSEARFVTDGTTVLEIAAVSDCGPVRTENQDGWGIVPLIRVHGCALLLADGMGGHAGGGEAARVALEGAALQLAETEQPRQGLESAFAAADSAVAELRGGGGMTGTTLVGAVISDGHALVGNVGDSRAYAIRPSGVEVLTQDHSLLEEMVRAGEAQSVEAPTLPGRNILTRSISGDSAPADYFELELGLGDVLLLCSDGLWGVLDDVTLQRLMSSAEPLELLVERACDAAIAAATRDNVTLLACRLTTLATAPIG